MSGQCEKCGNTACVCREVIVQLKEELSAAHERVRRIQGTLNGYRVKCPTCRCRILPGDECMCCAGSSMTLDDGTPI